MGSPAGARLEGLAEKEQATKARERWEQRQAAPVPMAPTPKVTPGQPRGLVVTLKAGQTAQEGRPRRQGPSPRALRFLGPRPKGLALRQAGGTPGGAAPAGSTPAGALA